MSWIVPNLWLIPALPLLAAALSALAKQRHRQFAASLAIVSMLGALVLSCIAFANARFGIGSGVEGWRTDRGRTYITLGPPQQKEIFRNSANLYPIEIWFYSSTNAALPPFFYVMFYQREGSGDYRFYSP